MFIAHNLRHCRHCAQEEGGFNNNERKADDLVMPSVYFIWSTFHVGGSSIFIGLCVGHKTRLNPFLLLLYSVQEHRGLSGPPSLIYGFPSATFQCIDFLSELHLLLG